MSHKKQKLKTEKQAQAAEALFYRRLNNLTKGIQEIMLKNYPFDSLPGSTFTGTSTKAELNFLYHETAASQPKRILNLAFLEETGNWRLPSRKIGVGYIFIAPSCLVETGAIPLRDLRYFLLGEDNHFSTGTTDQGDSRIKDPQIRADGWVVASGEDGTPDQELVLYWRSKYPVFIGACKRVARAVGPSDVHQEEIDL